MGKFGLISAGISVLCTIANVIILICIKGDIQRQIQENAAESQWLMRVGEFWKEQYQKLNKTNNDKQLKD